LTKTVNVSTLLDEGRWTGYQKLLIVGNAGAGAITGGARTPYIWRASFTNAQVSSVMGKHLSTLADVGPVYLIAPDYAAGTEVIRGFKSTFEPSGGKIAGEAKPAFGKTQDYQPFLAGIQSSGALPARKSFERLGRSYGADASALTSVTLPS